jgi:hypothetical protein
VRLTFPFVSIFPSCDWRLSKRALPGEWESRAVVNSDDTPFATANGRVRRSGPIESSAFGSSWHVMAARGVCTLGVALASGAELLEKPAQ